MTGFRKSISLRAPNSAPMFPRSWFSHSLLFLRKSTTLALSHMSDYFAKIREALFHAYAHDVINVAKAAAYSHAHVFLPCWSSPLSSPRSGGPSLMGETRTVLERLFPLTHSISCSPHPHATNSIPAR